MNNCIIHREIGIDMGHRVPDHGSKCRNPHGHRYQIIATCRGPILDISGNEENGMVVDFGNLKKYMMDILDSVFDHGFLITYKDNAMMNMYFHNEDPQSVYNNYTNIWKNQLNDYKNNVINKINPSPILLPRTCFSDQDVNGMKVIVVNYIPTAENIAKHMFDMLEPIVAAHYGNDTIKLINIKIYETPNGSVDYPGFI